MLSVQDRKGRYETKGMDTMNTSSSVDSALAFILSSYQAPTQSDIVQVVVKAGKVTRVKGTALPNEAAEVKGAKVPSHKASKATKVESATPNSKPALILPAKGSLDARSFLVAIRNAKSRDESIQAIAGFMGWNPGESFAAQDFQARAQAMRTIRPIDRSTLGPERNVIRQASRTLAGYVKGMPDDMAKTLENLRGRERFAYTEIQNLRRKIDRAQSESEKSLCAGLILVEEERIKVIAKEIARLV